MKVKKLLYSQKVAPYVFVLPFILSFAFFWIYPLITAFTMSFQDIGPIKSDWVGFSNYTKLLKDKVFMIAVMNSVKYMFFTLVLLIPFPMVFAVLLDSNLVKAKGVWKAILYVPALTSVVISGTLFRLMFTEYKTGQMNIITQALGLGTFKWLKMGWSGMAALLIVACWRWTGVNMLYFLSGLKAIDTALYEAADIDGATGWQKFKYVTLPLLKPILIYVMITSLEPPHLPQLTMRPPLSTATSSALGAFNTSRVSLTPSPIVTDSALGTLSVSKLMKALVSTVSISLST